MDRIQTREDIFGDLSIATIAAKHIGTRGECDMPNGTSDAAVAIARVNDGRWIADCPWCSGAERVSFEMPAFFCCGCRNAAVGCAVISVKLPTVRTREAVERHLVGNRPPGARHWVPGETVEDLRRQDAVTRPRGG